MSETFARLTVAGRDEGCRIDFAADVRIREPDTEGSTAIVSLEELAADKVLALFGRAAARDFHDFSELRRHFSWEQLFALATEKDAGFSRERFLEAVAAFDRLDRDEFELSAADYRQLRDEVHNWPLQIGHRLPSRAQRAPVRRSSACSRAPWRLQPGYEMLPEAVCECGVRGEALLVAGTRSTVGRGPRLGGPRGDGRRQRRRGVRPAHKVTARRGGVRERCAGRSVA